MKSRNIVNHLKLGIQSLNENNTDKALHNFFQHIATFPDDSTANKAIGSIYFLKKKYIEALDFLFKATRHSPQDVEVLNLIGACYMEAKQFINAHEYFNLAISIKPNYIDAIYNLGLLYYTTDNFQTAINTFTHLLSLNNNHYNAIIYKAFSLEKLYEYQSAIDTIQPPLKQFVNDTNAIFCLARCYLKVNNDEGLNNLVKFIDNPIMLFNLATFFLENNLSEKSIGIYDNIKSNYPDTPSLLNNLASAYDNLDQPEKAIEYFKLCIAENPEFTSAYINIGRVLGDINKAEEAITYLNKGLLLDPKNTNIYINLGRAYEILGKHDDAYNCFGKALSLSPENNIALYNLGNIYHYKGQYSTAIEYYKKCLDLSPDYLDAELNLGISELTLGDFENGWGHYFQRPRHLRKDEVLSVIVPGENFQNKNLYIRHNQGLGDELMFLRFLPMLKNQGAIITYRCQQKLYDLLKFNQYFNTLISDDDPTPESDYYFTIDDLPLLLEMDNVEKIPRAFPLCHPTFSNKSELVNRFKELPRPFIGITWRAGTQKKKSNFKSRENHLSKEFSLDLMLELFRDFKGTIFILQRNPYLEEVNKLKNAFPYNIVDVSEYNEDLTKMAQLLDFIDDSVCVSNTNVHILAGLHKTCNVIVPYPPDWRWMDIEGRSPWFPDIDTFRQTSDGNWINAFKKLKKKLQMTYGYYKRNI